MAARCAMNWDEYVTPFEKLHAVSLLSQRDRIDKFAHVIERCVTEGDYVIEIGAGSGILSLIAARAGAERVTGIEIDAGCVAYARKVAKKNGLDDKIDFVVSHYRDYKPEKEADVVICEMLSSMLLVEQQVAACFHAVSNLLRRGGTILPSRAKIYAVPAKCTSLLERFSWEGFAFPMVPQTVGSEQFTPLAKPKLLAEFDFSQATPPRKIDKTLDFQLNEDGTLEGIVGYFEVDIDDHITLYMEDGWRHLFLPFEKPRQVHETDSARIRITYYPGQLDTLRISLL